MNTVGDILSHFSVKPIAAFGFGAKSRRKERQKDCFPLSPSNQIHLSGIQVWCFNSFALARLLVQLHLPVHKQGVIEAYKQRVAKLTFSGPTYLAPVIYEALRLAKQHPVVSEVVF
jgi:hypothetical protein